MAPIEPAPLLAAVLDALGDWPHLVDEQGTAVSFPIGGEHEEWMAQAVCIEELRQLMVFSYLDEPVPSRLRKRMAELTTMANYGLPVGSFEMDLTDGELRFRTSLLARDVDVPLPLVQQLFVVNAAVFGRYLPAIRMVLAGADPAAAIAAVEGAPGDDA